VISSGRVAGNRHHVNFALKVHTLNDFIGMMDLHFTGYQSSQIRHGELGKLDQTPFPQAARRLGFWSDKLDLQAAPILSNLIATLHMEEFGSKGYPVVMLAMIQRMARQRVSGSSQFSRIAIIITKRLYKSRFLYYNTLYSRSE
jgi:hypothetical protein